MNNSILVNDALNWFVSPKSLILEEEGPWRVEMFAKMINAIYKNLLKFKCDNLSNSVIIAYEELTFEKSICEKEPCITPILDLQEILRRDSDELLKHALIHGSFADDTYRPGWSDLDTFFVVKNDCMIDLEKLLHLRNMLIKCHLFLKQVDPLAHHGFILCTEWDLSNYSRYLMPIQALKYSKSFISRGNASFELNSECTISIKKRFLSKLMLFEEFKISGVFRHHRYNNEYLNIDLKTYPDRMYQLKYFLETIMTLPAYYMEAIGSPVYKAESFSIREKFNNVWKIVDKATEIRNSWQTAEAYPYLTNMIPNWVVDILDYDYVDDALNLCNAMKNSPDLRSACE